MEEQFLSLTKAQEHTGLSRGKLRRFVESITKPDSHPDRHFIQPSPEEVAGLHERNHPFSWKISVELLDREFKKEGSVDSKNQSASSKTSSTEKLLEETVKMLKDELKEKNNQISKYQEREREKNILFKNALEKLMLLTEGQSQTAASDAVTVDLRPEPESDPSRGSVHEEQPSLWELVRTPFRFRKKRNQ